MQFRNTVASCVLTLGSVLSTLTNEVNELTLRVEAEELFTRKDEEEAERRGRDEKQKVGVKLMLSPQQSEPIFISL